MKFWYIQQPSWEQKGQSEQGNSDNVQKSKKTEKEGRKEGTRPDKPQMFYGGKEALATKEEALRGVPTREQEEYRKNLENCWCYGRSSHKTYECFSFNTIKGTALSPSPWKVAATSGEK